MPIGEILLHPVNINLVERENDMVPDPSEQITTHHNQSLLRRVGLGTGLVATSLLAMAGNAYAQESEQTQFQAPSGDLIQSVHGIDTQTKVVEHEQARCERQEELDQRQYTSCEYKGAYAAISKKHPKWVDRHNLSVPGKEDKVDRKLAFFKTHPDEYKLMRFEALNHITYLPDVSWVIQCQKYAAEAGVVLNDSAMHLLDRESDCDPSAWNTDTGAGGIPQALPFSKTHCPIGPAGAICQMKYFEKYVRDRYQTYEAALAHSLKYNWY